MKELLQKQFQNRFQNTQRNFSFNSQALKPVFSVLIILGTFFILVFLKMEERRLSYHLVKLQSEQKKLLEDKKTKSVQLAKTLRPQNLEKLAQHKLTFKKLESHQIIYLSGTDFESEADIELKRKVLSEEKEVISPKNKVLL